MNKSITIILIFLTIATSQICKAQISPIWQTYFGGDSFDQVNCTFECSNGDILIAGTTFSNELMPLNSGVNINFGGGEQDGFIARLSEEGELLWWTFFGGNGSDQVRTIQETESGEIWIGGLTNGNVQTSTDAIRPLQIDVLGVDCFLAKFSSDGVWLEGTLLGGLGSDQLSAMRILNDGRIIVTGITNSSEIAFGEVEDSTLDTQGAVFIAVLSSAQELNSLTYFEGTDDMLINDLGPHAFIDEEGNVVSYGYTESTSGIATDGAQFETPFEGSPGYLVKLSSTGQLIWGTYYGFTGAYRRIKQLSSNLFAIYGRAYASSNLATSGSYQTELLGLTDGFISLWNSNGELQWCSYLGSNDNSYFSDDILDISFNNNRIYFCGLIDKTLNISTTGAWQTQADNDATNNVGYFGYFDLNGNLEYFTYFSSPDVTTAVSKIILNPTSIYLSVSVNGLYEWISSPDLNQNFGGVTDICLIKFDFLNSVNEFSENHLLHIFPNPVESILNIGCKGLNNSSITIKDVNGRIFLCETYQGQIDVSRLAPGLYYVTVVKSDGLLVKSKFMKL